MSLQPNFEVLWIEQVLKNQVKPMLPSTLSTSLPSKDTKKASETAYSQIRCQRCFIFSLLNSPQPLISRGFPSFPTSSRMVSRQNVLFVIYSVKLHSGTYFISSANYRSRCCSVDDTLAQPKTLPSVLSLIVDISPFLKFLHRKESKAP